MRFHPFTPTILLAVAVVFKGSEVHGLRHPASPATVFRKLLAAAPAPAPSGKTGTAVATAKQLQGVWQGVVYSPAAVVVDSEGNGLSMACIDSDFMTAFTGLSDYVTGNVLTMNETFTFIGTSLDVNITDVQAIELMIQDIGGAVLAPLALAYYQDSYTLLSSQGNNTRLQSPDADAPDGCLHWETMQSKAGKQVLAVDIEQLQIGYDADDGTPIFNFVCNSTSASVNSTTQSSCSTMASANSANALPPALASLPPSSASSRVSPSPSSSSSTRGPGVAPAFAPPVFLDEGAAPGPGSCTGLCVLEVSDFLYQQHLTSLSVINNIGRRRLLASSPPSPTPSGSRSGSDTPPSPLTTAFSDDPVFDSPDSPSTDTGDYGDDSGDYSGDNGDYGDTPSPATLDNLGLELPRAVTTRIEFTCVAGDCLNLFG